MAELFDEHGLENGSAVEPSDERLDLEIRQQQEAGADTRVDLEKLIVQPQKLAGSIPHEFLSRDSILSQLDDNLDVEIGLMYHALTCDLEWAGLTESAQNVDSEHQSWLAHKISVGGFGRRELSTTNINRKTEQTKPAPANQLGLKL